MMFVCVLCMCVSMGFSNFGGFCRLVLIIRIMFLFMVVRLVVRVI